MSIDPQMVYAVVRDGKVVHVRMEEGVANACVTIEQQIYGYENVKVVPMILTEVAVNE